MHLHLIDAAAERRDDEEGEWEARMATMFNEPVPVIVTSEDIRREHEQALCGFPNKEAQERAQCREESAMNASYYFGKDPFETVLQTMFESMAVSRNADCQLTHESRR